MASRKLRHYFQGREIRMVTDQPLRRILHKPDLSGRMVNWTMKLRQFQLEFVPRTSIKAQALVDFIMECTFPASEPEDPATPGTVSNVIEEWTLFVDGSSTSDRSGAGIILISPDSFEIKQALIFKFKATNNLAEYEALLTNLRLAQHFKVGSITVHNDSQLVIHQIRGEYLTKDPTMLQYQRLAQQAIIGFKVFNLEQVVREDNIVAYALSKLATSDLEKLEGSVYLEHLEKLSISPKEDLMEITTDPGWQKPYMSYLQQEILPSDPWEAKSLKAKAFRYSLIDDTLYRKGFHDPLLKCLSPAEAEYAMTEVHEGMCGDHMGGKALAHKILRMGYYWPTPFKDAIDYTRKCK